MDYSTLRSARRASCLNAKLYGGRHSFPRLPQASSLLSMTIVERNDSSNDLTRRIFRDLVPFSLIGRSRLFSPSANWHEKQPQNSNLVWGILEDSVRGREMPFSREALPELSGSFWIFYGVLENLRRLGYKAEQPLYMPHFALDVVVWKIILIAMKDSGWVSILWEDFAFCRQFSSCKFERIKFHLAMASRGFATN